MFVPGQDFFAERALWRDGRRRVHDVRDVLPRALVAGAEEERVAEDLRAFADYGVHLVALVARFQDQAERGRRVPVLVQLSVDERLCVGASS